MDKHRSTIESPFTLLSIGLVGIIVGTSVGWAHFRIHGVVVAALGFSVSGVMVGVLFWMMLLNSMHRRRWRKQQRRQLRRKLGLRSPWGERRTEAAKPYTDRLANYLSHAAEDHEPPPARTLDSRMSFWSVFELPCEPTEAKPSWFVRRILQRIHQAVHG